MTLTPRRLAKGRTRFERYSAGAFLVGLHALPVIAIMRGTTAMDWWMFAVMYPGLGAFVATGLHRYFAHHAFRTSRAFQLFLGSAACLLFSDPIGFAGKHRIHHRYSDTEDDVHAPADGWWSCWVWSLADDGLSNDDILRATPDLVRFPELMFLHRWFWVPGFALAAWLTVTFGFSRMAIGYALAILAVMHASSAVNYVCHRWGTRRFETDDLSRNNLLVAIVSWGEGWHNNHHFYPSSARAGLAWWEVDFNYYFIRLLEKLGIVWDVRVYPEHVHERAKAA